MEALEALNLATLEESFDKRIWNLEQKSQEFSLQIEKSFTSISGVEQLVDENKQHLVSLEIEVEKGPEGYFSLK